MNQLNEGLGERMKKDLLASVVVFLVALPLCMGIAIASGVPAEKAAASGIITGIVGGIVVGVLAGSPLLITGPAAGLSVIIYELIQTHGWERIGLIIVMAGVMQLLAGLLKLGQWFRAVSPAVIHGMLAGIGVLILASQFHIMLDDRPKENGLENLRSLPQAVWKGIVPSRDITHDDAARIGLLTILVMVLWKPLAPKKLKMLPAPLLAVVLATAAASLLDLPIKRVVLPDNLFASLELPRTADLLAPRPWPEVLAAWKPLLLAGASIAFIASAETLLSASAIDQMHQGPRTKYDRELAAQGIGNVVSGLLGGLPMTGVIVRSAANVEAGARSNLSEILHGVWILLFVCLFPMILTQVPTASLAAILVYTGCKLVDYQIVKVLWRYGKGEVFIYLATVLAIVGTDLLTGVIVGMVLSTLKLLYVFSHLSIRVDSQPERRQAILHLTGTATFLRLPKLAASLEAIPPYTKLHVHFENLDYIDHACLDLLMSWEKQHEATGGSLIIDWDSLQACFHRRRSRRRSQLAAPPPPAPRSENGHPSSHDAKI